MPWPLVQPWASRAPNIINAPAPKATTSLLKALSPNRQRHNGGTKGEPRSPERVELRVAL